MSVSRFGRVNQWLTMARQWHVVDAKSQLFGHVLSHYLCASTDRFAVARFCTMRTSSERRSRSISPAAHKPIWHPETDCGDHVVVINCRHVAMHAFDWKHRLYHFDKQYPKSKALISVSDPRIRPDANHVFGRLQGAWQQRRPKDARPAVASLRRRRYARICAKEPRKPVETNPARAEALGRVHGRRKKRVPAPLRVREGLRGGLEDAHRAPRAICPRTAEEIEEFRRRRQNRINCLLCKYANPLFLLAGLR
ncbi:hypothetical protein L596_029526 [Steinernema carpocapsae]|uniref:Ribosomal protein L13 n=1 Tax=Steinernema carpocapsae TaxID=34508 RepID=A0A4U5LUX1_STECR|nr:hypothetical protein L596_029526 [Steinernema carpocapsae]